MNNKEIIKHLTPLDINKLAFELSVPEDYIMLILNETLSNNTITRRAKIIAYNNLKAIRDAKLNELLNTTKTYKRAKI